VTVTQLQACPLVVFIWGKSCIVSVPRVRARCASCADGGLGVSGVGHAPSQLLFTGPAPLCERSAVLREQLLQCRPQLPTVKAPRDVSRSARAVA
jgi:hypothetical protein